MSFVHLGACRRLGEEAARVIVWVTLTTGMRVGTFYLIRPMRGEPGKRTRWLVECERCGEKEIVRKEALVSGIINHAPIPCTSQVCRGWRTRSLRWIARNAETRKRGRERLETMTTRNLGPTARHHERLEAEIRYDLGQEYPEPDDSAAHELLTRGPQALW